MWFEFVWSCSVVWRTSDLSWWEYSVFECYFVKFNPVTWRFDEWRW